MIRELFLSDFSLSSCVWQSTIFIVVGLVGSFILRHRSARAHQVLFLAMMAAVIVPIMSILVKHYELGMFVAEPVVIQSRAEDVGRVGNYGAPGIILAENIEHNPGLIEKNSPPVMAGSESTKFPWRSVVLYAWIAASLILAARLLLTFALGVRLLGRALPLDCQRIEEALNLARAKLGIDKDVMVRSSRGVRSPVIWCWRLRPILLVPSAAGRLDNGIDWAGVLCHELAHWKRRDHISGLLAELAVCILPWHPLLWWAKSRLVRLSEQACDDWVVATGQPGTDYAESLLDLTPGGQMAFVPAVVRSKRGLADRVRRILKDSCGNPRTGAIWALAVSIMAACLVIGVACAQTRPAKPDAAAEREEKATKSLHHAVDAGDIEQVKLLIAKGADVNAKDKRGNAPQGPGQTPLLHAASGGHTEIAILLIAHGADVNASMAGQSWTPLLDAALGGRAQVVKVLLENGAKVDVGDDYGYTPLYYAIWSDDEESVRMLIAAGADVNRRVNEKDEYNAFFYAVWQGHKGIVKALIDAGANVNYKDKGGWTPLHYAIEATDADVAKLFFGTGVKIPAFHNAVLEGDLTKVRQLVENGTDVDTKDEFGCTPSYWALSAGQKKVLAYLLSQGADVTANTNDGCTLLHQASKAGFTEIVKQLIAKGVEVDAKPDSGNTPLKIAARAGHKEIVKLLIANGAVVNVTAKNGTHPLGDAAVGGHEEIVKLLLASGAKVNLQPEDRLMCGTALHAAAQGGHSTILDLLIANGADVNAVYKHGTPLHLAAGARGGAEGEKSAELVEKLLAKGADVNAKTPRQGRTPLHAAVDKARYKSARLLIAAGANINATDYEGKTPLSEVPVNREIFNLLRKHGAKESLHGAAAGGDIDQVILLISKGANVNAKTDGWLITPMHAAAHKGHKEICELLIAKGAEVNVKSGELDAVDMNFQDEGWTPLHIACAEGHQGVAKLLLAHGAVVNAKTRNSKTPLDVAKKKGHREVVELLQKHGAKEGISLQDRFENAKLISSGTWLEGSFQYRTDEEWFAIDVELNKSYLIYYDDQFGTGKYSADIETYLYKHIVDGFESKHCLFTDRHNVYHQPIKFTSDYNSKLYLRLISDNPRNTTFAVKYETEE